MQPIQDEMRTLLMQIEEKNRLKREVDALESQRSTQAEKLRQLENVLRREQRDVDQLQRTTLSSIWLKLNGTHEDVLRREQADVEAAHIKYTVAQDALKSIEKEISQRRSLLSEYSLCEHRYQELLAQKRSALLASAAGDAIRQLEEEAARLRMQQRETKEAIDAGGSALHTTDEIIDCLKGANGLATWDLLGGGMLVDLAKHSEMNTAQVLIERLGHQLRHFKTELSDVDMDVQLPVADFLSIADYIFDGLIADWMIKDRIKKSLQQVQTTRRQIEYTLSSLRDQEKHVRRQLESIQYKIDEAIRNA